MMWTYNEPVDIIFGRDALTVAAEEIHRSEVRSVLLVTSASWQRRGFDNMLRQAVKAEINVAVYAGVTPNPEMHLCDEAAAMARNNGAQMIIALGGGSVIDCAKVASVLAFAPELSCESLLEKGASIPAEHLPLVAIPTTAGTGSEVTAVAVISNHRKGLKVPLSSPSFLPQSAIVDPLLTVFLPAHATACTGFDALCHAVEAYWGRRHMPISDALAVEAIKLILHNISRAVHQGSDLEARTQMALASTMAGMAFARTGTSSCHACSYPLTGILGLAHGEACALTLDYFIRFNAAAGCSRVETLARDLGYADADTLARAIADLKRECGMRTSLSDFNLDEDTLEKLAQGSLHPNLANNPAEVGLSDLRQLYHALSH